MSDIRHRVGINAAIGEVYDALGTREGLAQWWTRDIEGESTPGGMLDFRFGGPDRAAVMEVVELVAPTRVAWRCVGGPAEWIGTTITFDLATDGDETVVLFTHGGWSQAGEFMSHCSTKWAYFLLGMKDGFEGGKAAPWPDDKHISSWA
jgi:uncharacterized protein YndB with AHSA1/START domain